MLIIATIWSERQTEGGREREKKKKKLSLPLADLYLSIRDGFKQATGAQEQQRGATLQSQRI